MNNSFELSSKQIKPKIFLDKLKKIVSFRTITEDTQYFIDIPKTIKHTKSEKDFTHPIHTLEKTNSFSAGKSTATVLQSWDENGFFSLDVQTNGNHLA